MKCGVYFKRKVFMRIVDLIRKNGVQLGAEVSSKDEAIERLIRLQTAAGRLIFAKLKYQY